MTEDDRKWSMIVHLAGLLGLLLPPIGIALGPAIAWLLKRKQSAVVDIQGKKALNFQIPLVLVSAVLALFSKVIGLFTIFAFGAWLAGVIFAVIAAMKIKESGDYNYPFSLPLLK